MKFPAEQGRRYEIRAYGLVGWPANDTTLVLYDTDGTTWLAYSDDHPLEEPGASLIEWEAPATGTYFTSVQQFNPGAWGCDMTYLLQAYRVTPTPTLTPTNTRLPTNTPTMTATRTPVPSLLTVYLPLVVR